MKTSAARDLIKTFFFFLRLSEKGTQVYANDARTCLCKLCSPFLVDSVQREAGFPVFFFYGFRIYIYIYVFFFFLTIIFAYQTIT